MCSLSGYYPKLSKDMEQCCCTSHISRTTVARELFVFQLVDDDDVER